MSLYADENIQWTDFIDNATFIGNMTNLTAEQVRFVGLNDYNLTNGVLSSLPSPISVWKAPLTADAVLRERVYSTQNVFILEAQGLRFNNRDMASLGFKWKTVGDVANKGEDNAQRQLRESYIPPVSVGSLLFWLS